MNKALILCLFALVAVAYAADEMSTEMAPESEDILSLVEEEKVNDDAKAAIAKVATAKTGDFRNQARGELEEAFIEANMDTEWIQQQELLETKTSGSGYQELKPIMEKVDELEKKIRARLAKLLTDITKTREDCKKQRATFDRRLASLAKAIRKNNEKVKYNDAKIKQSKAVQDRSRDRVTSLQKTLSGLRSNRDVDTSGYKKRLKKRMKEIEVLHKANHLVCTDFEDFKKLDVCKEILEKGKSVENSKAQVVDKPLRDLLKEANEKEMQKKEAEAALKAQQGEAEKKAEEVKKAAPKETEFVVANDPENDEQAAQLETAKRIAALQYLLSDSDIPERTYVPARKAIALIREGNKSLAMAKADDKTQKEMSLPELMLHLLRRITDEQKRETLDFMKQLETYHANIKDQTNAISAEVNRQSDEANKQASLQKSSDAAKLDNSRKSAASRATTQAIAGLNTRCRDADTLYNVKKAGREGELVNLEKLRSLLRVLQKSDLPKCPNDCTSQEQGKCIWKGMYGKDSYCACTKLYYGSACEKKRCPGSGGVMYTKTQRPVCSRRGTCDDTKGQCNCSNGYYHGSHKSCEYKVCPGNGNCNGRGRCNKTSGTCMCYQKYYGHDCSKTMCPSTSSSALVPATNRAVCSGHGSCNYRTGKCACSARFTGTYCQAYKCPNDCSGRGDCDTRTGRCRCRGEYHGSQCQYRRCPDNCSGRGTCNSNTGRCTCHNGSSGPACHAVSHCYSVSVNWSNTFARRGWGECPSGKLLIGLQKLNNTRYTCERRTKTCTRHVRVRRWFKTYTVRQNYTCYYHYCSHKKVVCDDLNCMKYARCAHPCEGGKIAPLGSCYTDNNSFWHTFDRAGWSNCRRGTYMRAMLRNTGGCQFLHCIEQIQCCSVRDAAEANCYNQNWWGCLDWNSEAMCTVGNSYFVAGFYRTGHIQNSTANSGVHNLEEARACCFRRFSTARFLR